MVRALVLVLLAVSHLPAAGVTFEGKSGPGAGRRIVLVSGDEEYRSEEALPQLARILSTRYGFRCTVLFAIDPKDGTVNPEVTDNIPGLEALDSADLMILFTRFRDLPDDQMRHIVDYVNSGKPIIGIRTATHAFALRKHLTYSQWDWQKPTGGFGRLILGETWVSHLGAHGKESTLAKIVEGREGHPILRGIREGDIWSPTDVYEVHPVEGIDPILLGEVLSGMNPRDPPVTGPKNTPMRPIAWTRTYTADSGKSGRAFATTMGCSLDLLNEGFRRMLVNATFWALGLINKIRPGSNVDLVGTYRPSPFGFGKHQRGRKPEDF